MVPVRTDGMTLRPLDRMSGKGIEKHLVAGGYERLKPGPGKSQESVASHQRARIHRAMVELAAEDGGRITVRTLTKLAGVSSATFYALFDGVDDCLLDTSRTFLKEVYRRILADRSFRTPYSIQCERTVRALFEGLTEDPRAGRLALIDSFAGGPAALGLIESQETSLEQAIRTSISRRGQRVSATAVSWVTAGALHAARSDLTEPRSLSARRDPCAWAGQCLVGPGTIPDRKERESVSEWVQRSGRESGHGGEAATLLSAIQRLALADGYWVLSESRVTRAAGVPATRFKHHFEDIDDAYLDSVGRLVRWLFEPLTEEPGPPGADWMASVCRQVDGVVARVIYDEHAGRLALSGILAPGVRGITKKTNLINAIGSSWTQSLPLAGSQIGNRTSMGVAGLWATLSRATTSGSPRLLRRAAPTYAYLLLSPMVGPAQASEAVKRTFAAQANRAKAVL